MIMSKTSTIVLTLGLAFGIGAGCNQAPPMAPMDTEGSTSDEDESGPSPETGIASTTGDDAASDSGSSGAAEDPDYHPLVDGATWTYRHTTSDLEVWDEVVTMREIEWEGGTAFEAKDNPGNNGESTAAVLLRDGTAVLRVRKDVDLAGVPVLAADYDPGFLRFDHAWAEGDVIVWEYDRTEYDGAGVEVETSLRTQIFTIEELSVEVTVPAGTFECVQFTRERLETGGIKRFWFADGVGKVKHQTLGSGATEELTEYSIP